MCCRKVAHVLIGGLDSKEVSKPFLVNCVFLEDCNAGAIARLVNNTLRMLFPNFNCQLAKVLVTDGAYYMLRAGSDFHTFYLGLVHMTCMAHLAHHTCEKVREHFTDINALISSCKKIFLKSPHRRSLYKERYPDLAFPPEPILTR